MICPRLVECGEFMGGLVVRRRRREQAAVNGGPIPASVLEFVPADWPGTSEYQRWAAWSEARYSWADENLPDGCEDLPAWGGVVPDQPWSEVEL